MTERQALEKLIKQNGNCHGVTCDDCPVGCRRGIETDAETMLKKAKEILKKEYTFKKMAKRVARNKEVNVKLSYEMIETIHSIFGSLSRSDILEMTGSKRDMRIYGVIWDLLNKKYINKT